MEKNEFSIVADGLTKSFGRVPAVQNISFTVRKGEIVGFLGPNGAGKSTTLRILTGLLRADSGSASVCGTSIAWDNNLTHKLIGYMPENNPLPEEMRVNEYLHFRAQLKGISWTKRRKRVEEVMELCDLARKTQRKIIGTLSKGYRQRVGIADAILAEPEITILDEPTIGLDPHQILSIRKLLNNLRGKTTVILSSHILSEVEVCCDRVLIMNSGHLVASGTADELREEFLPGSLYELEAIGDEAKITSSIKTICGDVDVRQTAKPINGNTFSRYTISTHKNGKELEAIIPVLSKEDDIQIRTLHQIIPGLEDIFLAATKRSWELNNDEIEPTKEKQRKAQ